MKQIDKAAKGFINSRLFAMEVMDGAEFPSVEDIFEAGAKALADHIRSSVEKRHPELIKDMWRFFNEEVPDNEEMA